MIHRNWVTDEGFPDGGVSTGIGYTIAWQRGPLKIENQDNRNGAFLIDVLEACKNQIDTYQDGPFACEENKRAQTHLYLCLQSLKARADRRHAEGALGTHKLDAKE